VIDNVADEDKRVRVKACEALNMIAINQADFVVSFGAGVI